MIEGRTDIKKAFLSGTTRRIQFQIFDPETGDGFEPSLLTMSVYDVVEGSLTCAWCGFRCWTPASTTPPHAVTSEVVNERNDVDVTAFVDSVGQVDLYLEVEDAEIDVPAYLTAQHHRRVVAFKWTWDSPEKVGKHEIVLTIAPDRETAIA